MLAFNRIEQLTFGGVDHAAPAPSQQNGSGHDDPHRRQHLYRRHDDRRRHAADSAMAARPARSPATSPTTARWPSTASNSMTFGGVISGTGAVHAERHRNDDPHRRPTPIPAARRSARARCRSATAARPARSPATSPTTAALAFNRSNSLTFGGVISGTGSVQQTGVGTTILTAANNYSGGTTISSGTLQIGDGGTTGSIAGDVANNAVLAFNRSNGMTFGGAITGTGSVQQNGAGTTILTGASSYTGGTTISAGTLQIGDGGTAGSIAGDVTNNAMLAFNRSNSMTFGGAITGAGSVQQNGAGTTILTGDKQLCRRHDDQRRHAADRRWRHDWLDRRRRHQQRRAGVQPLEQHDVRRRDLGHGLACSRTASGRRSSPAPTTIPAARRSAPARCRSAMAARPARSPATSPTTARWRSIVPTA